MKRRTFLGKVGLAAAGVVAAPNIQAQGAGERVVLGIIGCKRGLKVGEEFAMLNTRIAYTCDPDAERAEQAKKKLGATHAVADMRRIFDDKSVDAVVIATPDHWHAPASILACDAGKHVYVEKPCSHNIREGRLMIEAARRTRRVMQVGAQGRSTTELMDAIQLLREGAIGDILIAKAWNSQKRVNIGHENPSQPPAGFDYDLWVGPVPMRPFQANCHHYTWHWWYDFGTGDMGNDGVHELDLAIWGLGLESHPTQVTGHASKLYFDDDQQFPDTQYACLEYPGKGTKDHKLVIYEQRIWSPYTEQGYENGNAFYGTEGYMLLSKATGWKIFGKDDKLLREGAAKYSTLQHGEDFLEAIRTGRKPSGDIEIGHKSATAAHLANLLARTGRSSLRFDPDREQILDDADANEFVGRKYRKGHWAALKA